MWLKSSNDYDFNVGMVLLVHTVFNIKNDLWTSNIIFDTQNWQGPPCSTVTTFTFSYTFSRCWMQHLLVKEKFRAIGALVWIRASQRFSPVRTKTPCYCTVQYCIVEMQNCTRIPSSLNWLHQCAKCCSASQKIKHQKYILILDFMFFPQTSGRRNWTFLEADFGLWALRFGQDVLDVPRLVFEVSAFQKVMMSYLGGGAIIGPGPLPVSVIFCQIAGQIDKQIQNVLLWL